ncbi:hypothetical protein MPQ_1670 [Methylovorus sp. MP688]|nr:hypothetical protein MPQ_1670 [Methylovorus sp. MP688]
MALGKRQKFITPRQKRWLAGSRRLSLQDGETVARKTKKPENLWLFAMHTHGTG